MRGVRLLPSRRIAVSLFFAALAALGVAIFSDYGIAWDEPRQREVGAVSARYVVEVLAPALSQRAFSGVPALATFVDRDYGVVFEMPAYLVERLLGLDDTRDIFLLRHLLNFFVFVAGVYAVFRLGEDRFASWRVGLLGAACLVLSPRIFADAFYNSKDLVFLSAFAVATHTLIVFVRQPTGRTAVWHGAAMAVAIDVRLMAIVLPAATVAVVAARWVKGELQWRHALLVLVLCTGVTAVIGVALFPFLWSNPLGHLVEAFRNMSHFRVRGTMRYLGQDIWSDQVPWHYLPVWVAVTTPPVYLAMAAVGGAGVGRQLTRARHRLWLNDGELMDLVFVALLCGPVLAVVVLKSVVYDGWRHLYFVYPALLMVALRGGVTVWNVVPRWSHGRTVARTIFIS